MFITYTEQQIRAALNDALARHSVGDARLRREIVESAVYNLIAHRTGVRQ